MPIPRSLFTGDTPADLDLTVTSSWPAALSGELVLSAPHPDTLSGPHPFFGEGMTYRLSLTPGTHGAPPDRVAWRQRRIDSPSARLRARCPDEFRATMIGVHSPFGHTNAANTAPLPWGDRLFATWDAGRPVEIDPLTLGYLGDVGHRSEWLELEVGPQPLLPMVLTTAHPVVDPDRDVLWTVNTHWGALHVCRWDGAGALQRWPVAGGTIPQSVHTITQTRDWLVIADCAFKVEPQTLSGGARTEPANASGPVYLIRKDDLEATPPGQEVPCRSFELAPETNHYYATYDDTDGVTILFEHTECTDIAMTQQAGDLDALGRPCDPALRGLYGFPMSPDRVSLVTVDPERGKVLHRAELRRPDLLWGRQLNAIDWSTEGRAAPTVHHTVHQGYRPEGVTQEMLALYGDRVDRSLLPPEETAPLVVSTALPDLEVVAVHELSPDDLPTSPIFVPRDPGTTAGRSRHAGSHPGGHDGFVVVPVCNDAGFRIDVYDAAAVDRGPIATASAGGRTLPFVLHSAWMPSVTTPGQPLANRFSDELDRIDELPDDLARAARRVAHDLDEQIPMAP